LDKKHLLKFKLVINSKHSLVKNKNRLHLYIYNKKIVSDLMELGFCERKDRVCRPNVSDKLISHWIRGYFDGRFYTISGKKCGFKLPAKCKKNKCGEKRGVPQYRLRIPLANTKEIFYYLYSNCYLYLERIKSIWSRFLIPDALEDDVEFRE